MSKAVAVAETLHTESDPALAVIIPCRNERGNIGPLLAEIAEALKSHHVEVIVVDDASDDGGLDALEPLPGVDRLTVLRHSVPAGQSAAICSGLLHARAPVIVTIDGDGQNDPTYIPAMLERLAQEERVGLVGGRRTNRSDGAAKRFGSRFANGLRRRLLDDDTDDTGCGLKVIRRDLFLRLPYFDHWHRFLPALVKREGYAVANVDVVDRPRRSGVSKYGLLDRALVGALDLFGVWWLKRRRRNLPTVERIHEHRPSGMVSRRLH